MPLTVEEMRRRFIQNLSSIYTRKESENMTAWVLEDVLNVSRIDLSFKKKELLIAVETKRLSAILKRLMKHEPVQYVLGHSYFYGLKLKVNKHVLMPRPETEELVNWIIEDVKYEMSPALCGMKLKILDIGTGSGCIATALKKKLPKTKVFALDISGKAISIAKQNAKQNHLNIKFIRQDILQSQKLSNFPIFQSSNFSVIVSNPPYIPFSQKKKMSKNVLGYEPYEALFVRNENPLIFYDAIADFALNHLEKNGKLYFEINELFGKRVTQLLDKKGWTVTLKKDIRGKDRMIRCER